jgi:hypothetical protein
METDKILEYASGGRSEPLDINRAVPVGSQLGINLAAPPPRQSCVVGGCPTAAGSPEEPAASCWRAGAVLLWTSEAARTWLCKYTASGQHRHKLMKLALVAARLRQIEQLTDTALSRDADTVRSSAHGNCNHRAASNQLPMRAIPGLLILVFASIVACTSPGEAITNRVMDAHDSSAYNEYLRNAAANNLEREKAGLNPTPIMSRDEWAGTRHK